jgi:hypothetical protein
MTAKTITRRKLLKDSAIAAIGSSLLLGTSFKLFGNKEDNSLTKVILIRDKDVLLTDSPDKKILESMLDKALIELTSTSSASDAWATILKSTDILGIKTNAWNNLATPAALEEILTEKAVAIGINEKNISVNDRGVRNDEVFQRSTALINTRPMRTHAWSGVGSLIKNYIMFADRPADYHPDSCADLATLYELPQVKGKTRLNILVMLTPLFHGVGPHHFNKQYTWKYNGLIVGFDPVAVDSIGLSIIQSKRMEYFKEDKPLNPPAKHIMLADTRHHLGTADPEKINLIRIGWEEDILI